MVDRGRGGDRGRGDWDGGRGGDWGWGDRVGGGHLSRLGDCCGRWPHLNVLLGCRRGGRPSVRHQGSRDTRGRVGIIFVHRNFEEVGRGRGCGSSDGEQRACNQARGASILNVTRVRHESEPLVDADAAEKGLECTGELVHLPFHGIQPMARPGRFVSNLVKGHNSCFEDSNPLVQVLSFEAKK